ncbi:MAG: ThiF family adenylyltransferase [Deltaproteobacteria bacterium]|nr:ThiF family adenylyltransferase [Deltaproteobacteria bacterium]
MNYEEVYGRNIGLFTREEQQKLRDAKVAIAGVGGVGGVQAATLARFGIGKLAIMDPGVFDEPDMNRQYGATKSTLGMNKAVATGRLLRDINPFMAVDVVDKALVSKSDLEAFMQDSALVIDAIDYTGFNHKARFAETARALGVYNISAPIPDFGMLMMIFDPNGMTLEEFMGAPEDESLLPDFAAPPQRFFGSKYRPKNIYDFFEGEIGHISTNAGATALNGGIVATEAALIITGKRKKEDIVTVPRVTYIDLEKRIFEVFNPLENS